MILGAAPESGEQSEKEKGKTDKLWCAPNEDGKK